MTDVKFTARSYETGTGDLATLPALCNWMQEAAGINAASLGWGIRELQSCGHTWMLSRLRVSVARFPEQGETVAVRTWPSGMKGRLVALRCFTGIDSGGSEIFRAGSEWLYVDVRSQKIAKLPENFASLVPPGTENLEFPDIGGKFAHLPSVEKCAEILTRNGDLDFNDHVNNVHYVEWMLETEPPARADAAAGGTLELDIVFRSAARAGERLVSESCRTSDGRTLHAVSRPSGGVVLATAAIMNPGAGRTLRNTDGGGEP